MSRPGETDFTDLCTGNFSIRKETFARVGGFADLVRREDWEFSYRLAKHGVSLVMAPEAAVIQTPELDVYESLKDRQGEGIGDAAFADMHPEILTWLPLGRSAEFGRRKRTLSALIRNPRSLELLRPLLVVLGILERCGLRRWWSRLLDAMNSLAYFSGAASQIRSESAWLDLVDRARTASPGPAGLEIHSDFEQRPATGSAFELEVSYKNRVLGPLLPIHGGLPWDSSRFRNAVRNRYHQEIELQEVESPT